MGENFRDGTHVCPYRKLFKGLPEWLSSTLTWFLVVIQQITVALLLLLWVSLLFVVSVVWLVISFPLLMCWGCCRCDIDVKYMFLPAWYIFFSHYLEEENIVLYRRIRNIEKWIEIHPSFIRYVDYDLRSQEHDVVRGDFPIMNIA